MGKDVFNYRPYKSSLKTLLDQEIDLLQKTTLQFLAVLIVWYVHKVDLLLAQKKCMILL